MQIRFLHCLHTHFRRIEFSIIWRRWLNCMYILIWNLSCCFSNNLTQSILWCCFPYLLKVRLWDHINGCLLDTYDVKDKVKAERFVSSFISQFTKFQVILLNYLQVGELSEPNEAEDSNLAIADICLANDNSLVAVAIQR
jgi:hypothetical protein